MTDRLIGMRSRDGRGTPLAAYDLGDGTFSMFPVNRALTLLNDGAHTGPGTSDDQTNYHHRGVLFLVNATQLQGGVSLTLYLDIIDPLSEAVTSLGILEITEVGLTSVLIYPGVNESFAGVVVAGILPYRWRVHLEPSGGGNWDATVTANLII